MAIPIHSGVPTLSAGDALAPVPDKLSDEVSAEPFGMADEITSREAAFLLNVSVPFVAKLVEEGSLSCRKVDGEDRFPRAVVLSFRERDDRKRKEIARELTAEAQGFGLYD